MSIKTLRAEVKSAGKEYKVECSARDKSFILDEPEELGRTLKQTIQKKR